MTRKTPKPARPAQLPAVSEENLRKFSHARELLRPSTLAANAIDALKIAGDQIDVHALTMALREQAKHVTEDDLSRAEAMLICQAHTLDALFFTLMRRATMNMGEYLDAAETYMRMALRAQAQCRATLETLAAIKNPPVLIAKQANIANGPQQVNNGTPGPASPARAQETENPQNKLLEQQHGERLDTGAAGTASGADPAMATLGTVNGTKDAGR